MAEEHIKKGVQILEWEFGSKRVRSAIEAVKHFNIEIPSWIFGRFGGGRFGDFMPPGAARNIAEKLDDASVVNKLTGATASVAMHMLWDFSEDAMLGSYQMAKQVFELAGERGLRIGSISPTYFLKGSHRNSLSADEKETRTRYFEQTRLAAQIAQDLGGNVLTVWLPDGSAYPGQIDLQRNYRLMKESLVQARAEIDPHVWILIEYKVFEPGTYSTTIPDWGTAYALAKAMGENAGVLVDLGHHFHGANIEQIVARLIVENMRCGFHFNTRYAADDDHAVEPNAEIARIFYELVTGQVIVNSKPERNWAFMIDQCSSRENRLHAILHSVDTLQHSLARAILVQNDEIEECRRKDQIILANRIVNRALMYADVRPIVATARLERLLPIDPVDAFVESGYQTKIEQERK
ncbi:MAG: hypothetical protein EHM72_06440 [Calditrichaeota bacterium]|nr:MAG: hypothetical protein EHM72_06440 [Calditrichota bacterium]